MACRARGKTQHDGGSKKADGVIPVKQLEAEFRAELEGIGPRPPAQHAQNHERECDLICFRKKHSGCPCLIVFGANRNDTRSGCIDANDIHFADREIRAFPPIRKETAEWMGKQIDRDAELLLSGFDGVSQCRDDFE